MTGFLGTTAGFGADLNLVVQVFMGAMLLLGLMMARAKRFGFHGAIMAALPIVNLVPILAVMWPSLYHLVLPRIAQRIGRPYVAMATFHGIFGAVAELLGLYILLVVRTESVPDRWRFRNWKRPMRIEFAVWLISLISGIGTYLTWYGPPHVV